jgi:ribonuclease HI
MEERARFKDVSGRIGTDSQRFMALIVQMVPFMSATNPHFLLFSESRRIDHDDNRPLGSAMGAWHFVLESVDGQLHFAASDEESDASRERLELLAVVRGLEALDQPSRVTLVTPSRSVARGIRFGLDAWRENAWQWEHFGRMCPVDNADLWRRVDRALRFHDIRYRSWCFDLGFAAAPSEDRVAAAVPLRRRGRRRGLLRRWHGAARVAFHRWYQVVSQLFNDPAFQICPQ